MTALDEEYARLAEVTNQAFARADEDMLSNIVTGNIISPAFGLDGAIRPRSAGPPHENDPEDKYFYNPLKYFGLFQRRSGEQSFHGEKKLYPIHLELPTELDKIREYGPNGKLTPGVGDGDQALTPHTIPVTCQACGLNEDLPTHISFMQILSEPRPSGSKWVEFEDYEGALRTIDLFWFFSLQFRPLACTGQAFNQWGHRTELQGQDVTKHLIWREIMVTPINQ